MGLSQRCFLMKRNDFVDYVQLYFTKFLTLQRGMSPNTVRILQ